MKIKFVLFIALCFVVPMIATAGITNPPEVDSNVSPESGSLYLTDNALPDMRDLYTYKYTFDLSKHDEIRANNQSLFLIIFDKEASSEKNWIYRTKNGTLQGAQLIFAINFTDIFKGREFLGQLGYMLVDNRTKNVITEASGPNIDFNFRNEMSQKQEKGYTYGVEVRSSEKASKVWILYNDGDGRWERYYDYRDYISDDEEWKLLEWENAPYFKELEFVVPVVPAKQKSNNLHIEQIYKDVSNNSETNYTITIKNPSDITVYNISVHNMLAPNMEYRNSSYLNPVAGENLIDSTPSNSNGNWTLTWLIGDLSPNKSKAISLITKNHNASPENNRVTASGFALGVVVGPAVSFNASSEVGPLG